jgi:uncharacterized membrane protein
MALIQTASIADNGSVTGYFENSDGVAHGFLRTPSGTLTTFDVPGATNTLPTGINDRGEMVGEYLTNTGPHGFLRQPDGSITTFDVSGTGVTPANQTMPNGINFSGQITGCYVANGFTHGFVRDVDGAFKQLDAPGAESTCPAAINALGKIVGEATFGTFDYRPFRLNAKGWKGK